MKFNVFSFLLGMLCMLFGLAIGGLSADDDKRSLLLLKDAFKESYANQTILMLNRANIQSKLDGSKPLTPERKAQLELLWDREHKLILDQMSRLLMVNDDLPVEFKVNDGYGKDAIKAWAENSGVATNIAN
jgi:hypothetical protein